MIATLVSQSRLQLLDELAVVDCLPLFTSKVEVLSHQRGNIKSNQILEGNTGVFAVDAFELLELAVQAGKSFKVIAAVGWRPEGPKVWFWRHQTIISAAVSKKPLEQPFKARRR